MATITTHEAETNLERYLAEVEKGQEFIIVRGQTEVALLRTVRKEKPEPRPKVGDIIGPTMVVPDEALAPLSAEELAEWGL